VQQPGYLEVDVRAIISQCGESTKPSLCMRMARLFLVGAPQTSRRRIDDDATGEDVGCATGPNSVDMVCFEILGNIYWCSAVDEYVLGEKYISIAPNKCVLQFSVYFALKAPSFHQLSAAETRAHAFPPALSSSCALSSPTCTSSRFQSRLPPLSNTRRLLSRPL
jgi:hypothetical protein